MIKAVKPTKKLLEIAYHEAGHAFADFTHGEAIKYVTVVPKGDSGGHVRVKQKLSKLSGAGSSIK